MLNYHGFSSQAVLALGLLAFLLKIYQWIRAILSSTAAKKPLPNIPQDVIIEILSRLPVKTLCRFRCVSRSWHNLISDPGFIRLHLDFNRNNNKDKVFIVSTKEHCSPSSYSDQGNAEPLKETSVLHSADDRTVVLLLRKCVQTFKISGSCDGLLLLIDKPSAPSSKNSILILFNPSIRECKKLPEWPYSNEFEDQDEYSISGFGYNSRTNDYEVVRIGYDISDTKYGDCVASLYSMKTNSWRRIKATPPCRRDPSFEDSVGILSNGVLHWLLKYRTPFKNFLMVASYTLTDEKFSHVPLPSSVDGKRYCQLGVLRGCLGIIVHEYEYFNVWVMREYGIEDSWIKLTVEFPNVSLTVTLMRFSRNDELLLRIDDINLVLIKPEMKRTRGVKTYGVQRIRDAAGFCESLVSPHHLQNEAKH